MSNPYKPYTSTLEPEQIAWIKKTYKKVGFSAATDFVRELIRSAQQEDHRELGQKFQKARLEAEYAKAQAKAEIAEKERARIQAELDKIKE